MSVKTLGDLLETAIQDEISSQHFYRNIMQRTTDSDVQNLMKSLIKEERSHERILMNIKEMEIYDPGIEVDEKLLVHARQAHDIEIPAVSSGAKLAEMLEIALKRETKAYQIYKKMAVSATHDEVRQLFENMAADEMTHHKNIDMMYQAQTGQMGYEA